MVLLEVIFSTVSPSAAPLKLTSFNVNGPSSMRRCITIAYPSSWEPANLSPIDTALAYVFISPNILLKIFGSLEFI